MKNIYRNWVKPLLSRKGLLSLGSAFLLNYNPIMANESSLVKQTPAIFLPGKPFIRIPWNISELLGKKPEVTESTRQGSSEQKEGHDAYIYGEPHVLYSLVGPATYSAIDVGNEGIGFNYTTENGNHVEYTADSPRNVIANLNGYLDKEGKRFYTQTGLSAKKRNLDQILTQMSGMEGSDVATLDITVKDGVLTPEEISKIDNGYYGLWVTSIDDKTGEIEASVPILLKIDYKETKVEVEAPKEIPKAEEVKPTEIDTFHVITKAPKEYSKWSFGGAARFVNDNETKPAIELGFVYYPTEKFGLGGYSAFGPKFTSSTLTELSSEPSPEGIHGEGSINIDNDRKYGYSIGPRISIRPYGNLSFDISAGVAKVNETTERTDISSLVRGDEILDQDTDVLTVEDSRFAGDYSVGGNLPVGKNVSIYVGVGSLDGKGYGKLGVNILK